MNNRKQQTIKIVKMIDSILDEISAELSKNELKCNSDIDTYSLLNMKKNLEVMRYNLENDRIPQKDLRQQILSRTILDCWPLGSELGNKISEMEMHYIEMD